jgi:hypothetical protein
MTERTFERRLQQLIADIMQNPHRDELLMLMQEQLEDDTLVLLTHN